jgi:hypothetical protein
MMINPVLVGAHAVHCMCRSLESGAAMLFGAGNGTRVGDTKRRGFRKRQSSQAEGRCDTKPKDFACVDRGRVWVWERFRVDLISPPPSNESCAKISGGSVPVYLYQQSFLAPIPYCGPHPPAECTT